MTNEDILILQNVLFKFHAAATLYPGSLDIGEGNKLLKKANKLLLKYWNKKE